MREVAIVGVGSTPFGRGGGTGPVELALPTCPGEFAVLRRERRARYGTTRGQVGRASVRTRGPGAANPKARFRGRAPPDEALASRLTAAPPRLSASPPTPDGAAALVLCPAD